MSLADIHSDRIEQHDDGSVTLTLLAALKSKDGDIAFLTIKRPPFEDVLAQTRQPGDDMDKVGWLIARLSGVAVADFDTIDAEDAMVLAEVVGGFFDRLPGGGERYDGDLPVRHADRIVKTATGAMLTLMAPLTTKDGEITEITLRRPTFKEMKTHRGAGRSDLAASAKLIATLSGIGPLTLGKIDALDGLVLGEIVSGFLGNSRTTGGQ
jgi:Phage tail assembly chaperone proteins, E, or 41 or 14